jgi:hypothetical protein
MYNLNHAKTLILRNDASVCRLNDFNREHVYTITTTRNRCSVNQFIKYTKYKNVLHWFYTEYKTLQFYVSDE